jgi:hypothetical protein
MFPVCDQQITKTGINRAISQNKTRVREKSSVVNKKKEKKNYIRNELVELLRIFYQSKGRNG